MPEEIIEKIIERNRASYYYEVNGLFAMALEAFGIKYQFTAARPIHYLIRRPKTPIVILAKVDGMQWLCDLGFGSYSIRAPMDLVGYGKPIKQDHDVFMLKKTEFGEHPLQATVDDTWANQYALDLHAWVRIDFALTNCLNSANPKTNFVQKRLVIIKNLTRRSILLGNGLKPIQNGIANKLEIEDGQVKVVLQTSSDLFCQAAPSPKINYLRKGFASLMHLKKHCSDEPSICYQDIKGCIFLKPE